MDACPILLFDEALVVDWAIIGSEVRHTGNTRHEVNGRVVEPASGLAICGASDGNGFFLFSCDATWEYMADTWHRSIDEARRQAEFEYEGLKWQYR